MAYYSQYPYYPPHAGAPGPHQAAPQHHYVPAYPDDSKEYVATMRPLGTDGRSFRGQATPANPITHALPMGTQPERPINLTVNMTFPNGQPQEEENAKDKESESSTELDHAKEAMKSTVQIALSTNKKKGHLQESVHRLTGSQAREIVLSACLTSKELTNRVTHWIDKKEGKAEDGEDGLLGLRLQELHMPEMLHLLLWIWDHDQTPTTQIIIEKLVTCFMTRNKMVDLLS